MTEKLTAIIPPLIGWYDKNKRELPWRRDREPYHVWISEIMLQQTRIEAVLRYYERFMQALPDVRSLSEVSDEKLLKLWEGLGYYSRARNLKKAAQMIMRKYGGVFPCHYEELRTLPGIGEYTAGAIASICFDERVPAVDGNVLRVVARVLGSRKNILLPAVKKEVSDLLRSVMPERAGTFNEGLMELGETLCLPNGAPDCARCPIRDRCAACREGLTDEIPVRIKQAKRKSAQKTVFLILSPTRRIAIEKRDAEGLLSGLFQLPNIDGFYPDDELARLLKTAGLAPASITFEKEAKHVFTHVDWLMRCYRVETTEESGRFLWASEHELRNRYPLPTAFRKLL